MNYVNKLKHWLLEVHEDRSIPASRLAKVLEKLPLLMAMYVSSVLVAISTYNTFPSDQEFLRMSSAAIGGMAFDVILTSTVFSKRKNTFSIATILAALVAGLLISLDLYMGLDFKWLHATYIIMSTLYALHAATTRVEHSSIEIRSMSTEAPSDCATLPSDSYICPSCSTPLGSKQAYGSAKKRGYCRSCKPVSLR